MAIKPMFLIAGVSMICTISIMSGVKADTNSMLAVKDDTIVEPLVICEDEDTLIKFLQKTLVTNDTEGASHMLQGNGCMNLKLGLKVTVVQKVGNKPIVKIRATSTDNASITGYALSYQVLEK